MRMAVSCVVCVVAGGVLAVAQNPQSSGSAASAVPASLPVVDRFLETVDTPLVSYRAIRRLEAAARGGRMRASLRAETSLDPLDGFQFEVLAESGSGLIRSKVLRAALETERRAHSSGEAARSALSPRNYEFAPGGTTLDGLIRVGIRPRRQDTMLIDGNILLTANHGDLVRIEGRLVKRPSFWTRRVDVVREYARIAGVRVPIAMRSSADVLLGGESTFSMEYEYALINGLTVPSTVAAAGTEPGK